MAQEGACDKCPRDSASDTTTTDGYESANSTEEAEGPPSWDWSYYDRLCDDTSEQELPFTPAHRRRSGVVAQDQTTVVTTTTTTTVTTRTETRVGAENTRVCVACHQPFTPSGKLLRQIAERGWSPPYKCSVCAGHGGYRMRSATLPLPASVASTVRTAPLVALLSTMLQQSPPSRTPEPRSPLSRSAHTFIPGAHRHRPAHALPPSDMRAWPDIKQTGKPIDEARGVDRPKRSASYATVAASALGGAAVAGAPQLRRAASAPDAGKLPTGV